MGNKIKGFIEIDVMVYSENVHQEVQRNVLLNVKNIIAVVEDREYNCPKTLIILKDDIQYCTNESYQAIVDKIKASQFM